tara:strand:+ start:505 stop:714 length:210 start_codon:yes stop_codon:yes gene_type:complete
MERGLELQSKKGMTILTYRGKEYLQQKKVTKRKTVELSYRRSIYTSRQADVSKQVPVFLIYRGIKYERY